MLYGNYHDFFIDNEHNNGNHISVHYLIYILPINDHL